MKSQRFGIEMEMTGISRKKAAEVIAAYFGARAVYDGGSYDAYHVTDGQGRNWKVVSDASIHPTMRDGRSASNFYKVEVVSPICHYEDIETIQELVRKLRRAGACVNDSCGIHIHVDAAPHSAKTLRNLVNIMVSKEDLLYKALAVDVAREDHYCQKTDLRFLDELNRKKPKSIESFERMWYHGDSRRYTHYDNSRYRALNLHSVFASGTIEFRLYNGTMHAGKIKTYIQLSLAISHQALVQKGASHSRTKSTNEKYTFRTWLLRLGMIGEEFQTARKFLLENLEGNIAWKDPAQAERQKERLAAKRVEEAAQSMQGREAEEVAEQESETETQQDAGFSMQMF